MPLRFRDSIPIADADGDVGNLADLIGGPGTSAVFDPDEASENEPPSLINVGGMGEDLRGLTDVHNNVGTPRLTTAQVTEAAGFSAGSLAITTGTGFAAGLLVSPPGASAGAIFSFLGAAFPTFYGAADLLLQAFNQQRAQQDPFDPHYKQVYTPITPPPAPIPFSTPPPGLTTAQQTALTTDVTSVVTAQGKVASDSDAVYVTQNRLFSAYNAGDLASFNLQNTTLNKYVATLATDEIDQGKAETTFAVDLSNLRVDVRITPAEVTAFQNTLKAQGFAGLPAQEQAIIKTYLPDPADQQALVNQVIQVDPNTVPSSFIAQLQNQAIIANQIGKALTISPLTNNNVPNLVTKFTELDTSTNATLQTNGTPYSGPVAGLQWEDIHITTDNLNITANVPNAFMHSGSGEDALDVTTASGNNVLDGGTGSNFLNGGSGTDTFFVDDRAATADIWSTVAGFHAGDAATIWGVTQQDFTLAFVDGQGAAGFTGLTLHATASGKPTASLTLAGYSQADTANGRLSVSFGTDPASGSAFMFIHGNS